MQKNAAAKNRHSTLWGIACRMIFYSSSPKPHVAQILGGKLWAEIRNAATSTTHLGHNLGLCLNQGQQNNRAQAPYMSRALLHTPLVSPCGGTFKRRSTTDLKCTYAIFEVKCLACCCLFRTKIRRCYPSVSRDGVWTSVFLYSGGSSKCSRQTKRGVHPLTWGFIWSKQVH